MINRKCIIQIPCYNEEEVLPITLAELPRALPGFDAVEWLVIDDGSSDRTAEVARANGVDHVVVLSRHLGLAKGFMEGIKACLQRGADVIVNTDADNQYCAQDIERLVVPILVGEADFVVGARPVGDIAHFSLTKRLLQRIGSWVVRLVSKTEVADAPSGFRAFNRDAALRINVFNSYTYTLETIIQAGCNGMRVVSVPVRTNAFLRSSRLVKNSLSYVAVSALTIFRIFTVYYPFKFFSLFAAVNFVVGFALGVRFIVLRFHGGGQGHIQSLILCAIFILAALSMFVVAVLANLMAVNRQLLEKVELRLKLYEYGRDDDLVKDVGWNDHGLGVGMPPISHASSNVSPQFVTTTGARPDKSEPSAHGLKPPDTNQMGARQHDNG